MIKVFKSERRLEVIKNGKRVFECPVSLGFCPIGHKESEGDGKTPEGKYRICSVNRQSKFHISLGVSYPSRLDALNAYKSKHLSLANALKIMLSVRPKWNTPLGGFIMLHGEAPQGKTGDWTQGCISVSNSDIEAIASLCRLGERIDIYK